MIIDPFTGSQFTLLVYTARFPGQSLDTGGWGGVGHGIAMGFGVQVAKPGPPVLVVMGDGGMELATCARHKMLIVTILWNNSVWMGSLYGFIHC